MRHSRLVRLCGLAVLPLALGCSGPRPPAPGPSPAAAAAPTDATGEIRAVVALFLGLEARGSAAADTLLDGADFVMTGVKVTTRPRLAGLNGPGDAVIEEASAGLTGSFAWIAVGYRFSGRTPDLAERARATFILEKQRAGWRIRHVHSSMVSRW